MTPQEALADVCRHFCANDQHDDACTALRTVMGEREVCKRHLEIGEQQLAALESERNAILSVAARDNATLARVRTLMWRNETRDSVSGDSTPMTLKTHVRVRDLCEVLDGTAECPSECGHNEPCPDRWHDDVQRIKGGD